MTTTDEEKLNIPDGREPPRSARGQFSAYREMMSSLPLLTREQEIELARTMELAKRNILRLLCLTSVESLKAIAVIAELNNMQTPNGAASLAMSSEITNEPFPQHKDPRSQCANQKRTAHHYKPEMNDRISEAKIALGKLSFDAQRQGAKASMPGGHVRFLCGKRIHLPYMQIKLLADCIREVLCRLERAEKTIEENYDSRINASKFARGDQRERARPFLATIAKLRRITARMDYSMHKIACAKERFVLSNLRLVYDAARSYSSSGLELSDVIQEGLLGVMRAVDEFDYRMGNRFATYAKWWIRHYITRAAIDEGRTIRIPVHIVSAIQRFREVSNALRQSLGREPSLIETFKEMKISILTGMHFLTSSQETISLDAGTSANEELKIKDRVEDDKRPSPEEHLMKESLHKTIYSALLSLSPQERDIVHLRFGLNQREKEFTLQECSAMLQLTQSRVRHIEREALLKLRHRIIVDDDDKTANPQSIKNKRITCSQLRLGSPKCQSYESGLNRKAEWGQE
jgi:RNA polymerase primary sigma factor